MANARKCDRCEKCFDPYRIDGMMCRFRNPIFQNRNDVREGVIGKTMVNDTTDAYIDLCPECSEMFEAFMSGADGPETREEQRCKAMVKSLEKYINRKREEMLREDNDGDG